MWPGSVPEDLSVSFFVFVLYAVFLLLRLRSTEKQKRPKAVLVFQV